jgi:hypothetical protein
VRSSKLIYVSEFSTSLALDLDRFNRGGDHFLRGFLLPERSLVG